MSEILGYIHGDIGGEVAMDFHMEGRERASDACWE